MESKRIYRHECGIVPRRDLVYTADIYRALSAIHLCTPYYRSPVSSQLSDINLPTHTVSYTIRHAVTKNQLKHKMLFQTNQT
jgi:hypothetical protein